MPEQCKNCGAELFAGQQFCRACGTPVGDERPTRILSSGQPAGDDAPLSTPSTPLHTAPLSATTTDPFYAAHQTGYQSAFAPAHGRPVDAPATPRRRGSRHGWIVAFLALGVFGVSVFGALMYAISVRRANDKVVVIKRPQTRTPAPPPVPVIVPRPDATGGHVLDEEGAEVSGKETLITKSYALANGAKVSIKNIRGAITVTGWDDPRVEVRIIKRGSAEGRKAVGILESVEDNLLSLQTPDAAQSLLERVEYEIKVPRNVRELEVSGRESEVRITNITQALAVDVITGSIELTDVSGAVRTKIIKGDTEVVFDAVERNGAQELTSVRGNIEVHLRPETNADLKVETIDGDIDIDDGFQLKVEKNMIGKYAAGRLGAGGAPLLIKTVNGDIKIIR